MMKDIDFCDVERYSTVILTFQHFTSAHKKNMRNSNTRVSSCETK